MTGTGEIVEFLKQLSKKQLFGLILAVNLVIYLGPDLGYESSIGEVFDHNTLLGLAIVTVIVAGPVVGIMIALRLRQQSGTRPQP